MNHFSFDILLEFLYEQFAITFAFCFIGSFIKEFMSNKNTDSNSKKGGKISLNLGKMMVSTIFSTLLVCAGADYITVELHIGVYAMISVIIGMWGIGIIKCIIDKKFISTFCASIAKNIANPFLKSVAESASKTLEDNKSEKKKEGSNDKKDDDNSQTIKIEITNK